MNYEVGQVVRIVDDLAERGERREYEDTVGYCSDMERWAGQEMTIADVKHISRYTYYICEEDYGEWMWHESMFTTEAEKEMKEERPMVEHTAVERIDREDVKEKMYETLGICDIYHPTDRGINTILDKWTEVKGKSDVWESNSVLDILSKHPDYVPEKGYIVKKREYDRGVDTNVIQDVLDCLISALMFPVNNGILKEVREDYNMWANRKNILDDTYIVEDNKCYTHEDVEKVRSVRRLISFIKDWAYVQLRDREEDDLIQPLLINDNVVKAIEESGLTIRGIRAGQKFNKVINKILTETGIKDRWSDYNRQIARLSDAASPLKFTKYTIISANPVDYWRMSFGSSWKSCQTIDKEGNYRPSDGGDGYEGMHASGTESYMLDPSTVVMYTVDEKYDGSDYEMEPKLERCLFHLGERKFVMGRVYPQGTDGEAEVYRQWRNIFQQIIAECMEVPNYWKTEKDVSEKLRNIYSTGTHYRDYEYGYCDIAGWSYLKPNADSEPSDRKIAIGAQPICPCCGRSHWEDDSIECECCRCDARHECYECGEVHDEADMYEIDGEWYCQDCVIYCDYHEEYEVNRDEHTYVQNYGYVCDQGLADGPFVECEQCNDWYYEETHYGITTEDGSWFCCSSCAEHAGYIEAHDGKWYPEEETIICDECGAIVTDDEWDVELGMCVRCAEGRMVEEEIA